MPHDASHPIVRQLVQLDGEIWKPIPSTAGRYEASSLGRIRSLIAANHRGIFPRKVPLVCTPYSSSEYLLFNLRINGRYRCRQLGSLILEAHVGPAPTVHHEAAHVDGDASNNRIENLVWATPKENARHKQWHNTQPHRVTRSINGEDHFRCTRCDNWLPRSYFYTNSNPSSRCGITSWCRRCCNSNRNELRGRRSRQRHSWRAQ
jgi:hypothetical protein